MAREKKHLFHFGVDAKEWAIVNTVAQREGVSLAEATRRIIRSCVIGDELIVPPRPAPSPKKRRRSKAVSAESNPS